MRRVFAAILRAFLRGQFILRGFLWRSRLQAVGKGTRFYPRVVIYAPRNVRFGMNCVVNDFVHIWGAGGVRIGNDVLIAAGCTITSQSHRADALSLGKLYRQTDDNGGVKIGNNVWLGSGVIVLPNVEIGDNAIVAAGSVVTKSVPAGCLVAGVPARFVRELG